MPNTFDTALNKMFVRLTDQKKFELANFYEYFVIFSLV